jgi:hypothetical protein
LGKSGGDRFIVDDRSRRDQKRANSRNVWFEAAELGCVDLLSFNAVLVGALEQGIHPQPLGLIRSYEKLAAGFEFYALLHAKSLCGRSTLAAKARLQTSWRIIDTGMDDPAVTPGLVLRDSAFLFKNNDRGAGARVQNLPCGREADDTSANDCKIIDHSEIGNHAYGV